jgi:hypothetical protein
MLQTISKKLGEVFILQALDAIRGAAEPQFVAQMMPQQSGADCPQASRAARLLQNCSRGAK